MGGESAPGHDARTALSLATLALLKGSAPAPLALDKPRAALEEEADGGSPEARSTIALLDRLGHLAGRVARALAAERVDVVVADGSSMTMEEAERFLANKEERRCHPALRGSIDAALTPFRQFQRYGSDFDTRELVPMFLVDTLPLRDAALEALASLGGMPLEEPLALAWGLDLPDPQGAFGEETTKALWTAVRDQARIRAMPVPFRAPRALAGAALDVGTAAPERASTSYAWPPAMRRCDRHVRTLEAAGTALAWAHGAPAAAGTALALALASPPLRMAIGVDARTAERAGRVCAAAAVLRARATLALAALPIGAHEDDARDAVRDALQVDPGRTLLAHLAQPSWASVDDEAPRALLHAPTLALRLRDAFDETWPLRREAWDAIEHSDIAWPTAAASVPSAAPSSTVAVDRGSAVADRGGAVADRGVTGDNAGARAAARKADVAVRAKEAAAAWRAWAGAWL